MDDNTFLKRLERHTQTTKALLSLGKKFLSNREHGDFAEPLTQALGSLKGPLMKAAQILSTIPDMLPPEYVAELQSLQCHAPPMGKLFVKRRLRQELGENWQDQFESFDMEAAFAASLGQVHRAQTMEGDAVACKLQYPHMEATLQADLQQLTLLIKLYEKKAKTLNLEKVLKEVKTHLMEEVDYTREAKNMALFKRFFEESPALHVPESIPTLSTKKLLTMTWLEGKKITAFEEASQEMRNTIAKNLFEAWYKPLYQKHMLHGDPHLGNYTVREDGSLNLLDFGCVRFFEQPFMDGIFLLYEALQKGDQNLAREAYHLWGFENLTEDLVRVLNLWSAYLYDPILEDGVRPIHRDLNTAKGQALAQEIQRQLKALGGITPPREFVLMDRAAVGLGAAFIRLRAELNWHDLFQSLQP